MCCGTSCILPHVLRLMCTTINRQFMMMFPSNFFFVCHFVSRFLHISRVSPKVHLWKYICPQANMFSLHPHYSTSMFNMNSIEILFSCLYLLKCVLLTIPPPTNYQSINVFIWVFVSLCIENELLIHYFIYF